MVDTVNILNDTSDGAKRLLRATLLLSKIIHILLGRVKKNVSIVLIGWRQSPVSTIWETSVASRYFSFGGRL
jgi:predicted secreted protein